MVDNTFLLGTLRWLNTVLAVCESDVIYQIMAKRKVPTHKLKLSK